MPDKEISNPYSTGQGGANFENRVQSAYTVLMLTKGISPCLPPWPIAEIKLQGKYQGFNTDDLIITCKKPNSERKAKLLGQIKHKITFTKGNQTLKEVLAAAWKDYNNNDIFSADSHDALALITGPLSAIDIDSVRSLLEQARYSSNSEDFIKRINLAKFTGEGQREKLDVFKTHLKDVNSKVDLTNDQLWRFLKSFHLLIYDLDIKGVVLSLLHTLIEQYSQNNSVSIWSQIIEHVQWINENAGIITISNIPEAIREQFKHIRVEEIPVEYVKDTTKIEIDDWNDYKNVSDLVVACIVGSWNENSAADKSILSKLAGLEYDKWIHNLRDILQYAESPVSFKNGIWNIKDREKLWATLGARIFDDHLDVLKGCAVLVLTEKDPKFELPKEERFAASVHGKVLNYSSHIRKGLAEALALVGCFSDVLKNTSINKANNTANLTIGEILRNADWSLWASLNDLLPILAEAAPEKFIDIVEEKLRNEKDLIVNLFAQEGDGITGWNYTTGLLWALEALAWDETFLVNVTVLLGELSSIDPGGNWVNRPANSLTTIFLPWKPQTKASFEKRKVAIQTLNREFPDVTWKLLLSLLPSQHQITSGTYKPRFRKA
ncbi:MAG: hypothetical protein ACYC49_05245 [Ignavibacteriaceae bacterium]